MLVLAIDIGTSSSRTALFDADGRRIEGTLAQRAYPLRTDRDGRAELDPARLLAAVKSAIDATLAAARADRKLRGRPIAAVGGSCFWHSFLAVDRSGEPLGPVWTWADSRCRDDAAALRRRHDEREWHARTGCMVRASFWPAKLAWLTRTQRRLMRRAPRLLSPAEWLFERFTGVARCAHGMATATGLYDPARLDWDDGVLGALAVERAQLAPLSDHHLLLDRRWARRWPELADARWYPAIGDGAANNLGAGASRPGWAAINFGTSGAVRIMRDHGRARAPYGLFCYRVDERRFLLGGAISNAGSLRAWCLEHLRLPDEAALERTLAARPLPAHGLRVLPFWLAERAPSWRDDLTGAIVGLTQSTTAVDLLQAITEATYHRLAGIVDQLPGGRSLRFVVGGGIQRSPQALQRLADVLGRRLIATDEPELSLRGAAVLALERLDAPPAPPAGAREVRPRREPMRAYARERKSLAALERRLDPKAEE